MQVLSVIIPTYNRKDLLRKTLDAYKRQSAGDEILEILVVDDGSTDGTKDMLEGLSGSTRFALRYFHQERKGQGAARNCGIRTARGSLVLFADDDIIPAEDMVAQHLAWHREHPEPNFAVMGHVAWADETLTTPFMRWLARGDNYFRYIHFTPGEEPPDIWCWYFGDTSLKLDFIKQHGGFDETYKRYGFEDTEMGVRLKSKGLHLVYNPNAVGYHLKHLTFWEECHRWQEMQANRRIFEARMGTEHFVSPDRPKPSNAQLLKWRVKMKLFRIIVPLLSPIKPLLDSQIPLPSIVYKSFRLYYAAYLPERLEEQKRSEEAPPRRFGASAGG